MYCSNCGHKNQDDDRFCRQCGTPLKEPKDSNLASDNLVNSSELKSQSFLNQPTQLIIPSSSNGSAISSSSHSFNESKNEENQNIKSLEDLSSLSGSSPSNDSFIKPDGSSQINWNSTNSTSKHSKKGRFIAVGMICLILGIGGGAAYYFFNGEEFPFISSLIHSNSSSESNSIKVAQEGEETSQLEWSSENESGFRISVYSSSTLPSRSETTASISKEKVQESTVSSQPIKVQITDPYVGKYKTNYVMTVRKEPSYEGEKINHKEKGEVFEVIKSESSSNNSVWGQLPDGGWICLQDNDLVYVTGIQ